MSLNTTTGSAMNGRPLAERMRPAVLSEFVGQTEIFGRESSLRRAIDRDSPPSSIFWGPPGSGKTTLARIIAGATSSRFLEFSAVLSGIKEVREVMRKAADDRTHYGMKTIVFVDEIHRFNKAQQDAFLPHVESGGIILIGATTENPSFEVIGPLLSRLTVFVLQPLTVDDLKIIVERALEDTERGLGGAGIRLEPQAMNRLAALSDGDARRALNLLESSAALVDTRADDSPTGSDVRPMLITVETVVTALSRKSLYYDRDGEEHFNIISALHKSLRNSDPDAGLYWLGRMIEAGEDPLYIARRLVRFASEDVGLADPNALRIALSARDAVHFIGLPEGALALAEAAVYLALAPKSNALYRAYSQVRKDIAHEPALPVPLHLRNAPTRLMKDLHFGKGYEYAHNRAEGITPMSCLPEPLAGRRYYRPEERGLEKRYKERFEEIRKLKRKMAEEQNS